MKRNLKTLLLILLLNLFFISSTYASDSLLFVTITSECCNSCQKLKPVLEELESEYGTQITFIKLDVSSKSSIEESRQIAHDYDVLDFFNSNLGQVPKVGILCSGSQKVEKVFLGETRMEIYKKVLDEMLLDTSKICSL